jgi:serine protease AprX
VIDSGIGSHADLKNAVGADRVVVRWSAVSGPNGDEFGHGTHVAGIIGGNAKKSSGPYATQTFRGVAPDVKLISMKVLNADGSGQVSDVLEAIDWILQNRQAYGIKIVNLSLGHRSSRPARRTRSARESSRSRRRGSRSSFPRGTGARWATAQSRRPGSPRT